MTRKKSDPQKAFIQKIIRELKFLPVVPRRLLVALSGGVDSVGLVLALNEVKALFSLELIVAHVHHGKSSNLKTLEFRNRTQKTSKVLAQSLNLEFVTNDGTDKELFSESDLRKRRYQYLKQWALDFSCEAIALGHHQEDLLETQMMRLMRGSSSLGLGAMSLLSEQGRLRPFLNIKKSEVEAYVLGMGKEWVDDPSNAHDTYLRNRVRGWLEQMEEILPGAQANLSKSLQRIVGLAQEKKSPWKGKALTESGIDRRVYMALATPYKMELIAHYLRLHFVEDYTSGQILELMKRLDLVTGSHTLKFFGRYWTINQRVIKLEDR